MNIDECLSLLNDSGIDYLLVSSPLPHAVWVDNKGLDYFISQAKMNGCPLWVYRYDGNAGNEIDLDEFLNNEKNAFSGYKGYIRLREGTIRDDYWDKYFDIFIRSLRQELELAFEACLEPEKRLYIFGNFYGTTIGIRADCEEEVRSPSASKKQIAERIHREKTKEIEQFVVDCRTDICRQNEAALYKIEEWLAEDALYMEVMAARTQVLRKAIARKLVQRANQIDERYSLKISITVATEIVEEFYKEHLESYLDDMYKEN